MSASTGTINSGIGTRQLGTALAGVALAVALAVGLAFGVSTASRSQAAPAAGAAPALRPRLQHRPPRLQVTSGAGTFDHGSSIDLPGVKVQVKLRRARASPLRGVAATRGDAGETRNSLWASPRGCSFV